MSRFGWGTLALIAAGLTTSAQAADFNYGRPAYTGNQLFDGFSWARPYLGVNLGYAWGSVANNPAKPSGFVGGVQAGYNWQSGPIVIGLEGDALAAGISGSERFNHGANTASPDIDAMADLRLRAGVTVMPRVLLFVTGGIAWADVDLPVKGPGGGSGDGTFFGWTAGGGAEVAINPNWSARFDYQFTDFDSETVSYPGGDVKYDPDVNTYRGALIYKF